MAENSTTISEIVRLLPIKLQHRFTSIVTYIQAIIEEEEELQNISLSDNDKRLINIICFIYMIERFFRSGSYAANKASTTFKRFGLKGFRIGRKEFTQDNQNTKLGESLANQLRFLTSDYPMLQDYILNAPSIKKLVEKLIKELSNEQTLD